MRSPLAPGHRAVGRDRGQAMVEFALIAFVFILILVGIFDMSRAIYAYSTVQNAAREGAREAIVDQYDPNIRETVRAHAVGIDIDPSTVDIDYRLPDALGTEGSCNGLSTQDKVQSRCFVVVRVTHDFVPATPVLGQIIGTASLEGEAKMPLEIACDVATCPIQ